jgi:hypothetical protein
MKKSIFVIALGLTLAANEGRAQQDLNAQVKNNYYSVSITAGTNGLAHPVNNGSKRAKPGLNIGANGDYMFNSWIGMRGDFSYNLFNSTVGSNVQAIHLGLNAVVDLTNIKPSLPMNPVRTFSFQSYAGFGLATLWQGKFRSYDEGPYNIQGNDDMLFMNFGFVPKYRINTKTTINLDACYVLNIVQDNYFDGSGMYEFKGYGGFLKFGVGLTYEFRK